MLDHLRDLFRYDHRANGRWLDRLRDLPDVEPRTRDLMAHIPAIKQLWITRLRHGSAPDVEFWPTLSWDECAALLDDTNEAYQHYLDGCAEDDLTTPAVYENSKGTEFHTPVREVLMHVITHGHYHRGQIAQAVRRQGYEPINTGYIFYTRQREGPDDA